MKFNILNIIIFLLINSPSFGNDHSNLEDLYLDSEIKKLQSAIKEIETALKYEEFQKSVRGMTITKNTPTAYKSNGRWVVPKNGTIEKFFNKGFMLDPDCKYGISIKPNPFHPKYEDAVKSLKPKIRYAPSRGFKPKSNTSHLSQMGSLGDSYQLEKSFVWIKVGRKYLKIRKDGENSLVSLHEYKDGSPIVTHKLEE